MIKWKLPASAYLYKIITEIIILRLQNYRLQHGESFRYLTYLISGYTNKAYGRFINLYPFRPVYTYLN